MEHIITVDQLITILDELTHDAAVRAVKEDSEGMDSFEDDQSGYVPAHRALLKLRAAVLTKLGRTDLHPVVQKDIEEWEQWKAQRKQSNEEFARLIAEHKKGQ